MPSQLRRLPSVRQFSPRADDLLPLDAGDTELEQGPERRMGHPHELLLVAPGRLRHADRCVWRSLCLLRRSRPFADRLVGPPDLHAGDGDTEGGVRAGDTGPRTGRVERRVDGDGWGGAVGVDISSRLDHRDSTMKVTHFSGVVV